MSAKSKKAKAKGINSFKMAKLLEKAGRKVSSNNIRAYWIEGAPRDSAEKFLVWLEENHPKKSGDAALRAKRMEKLEHEIKILRQSEIREARRNEREAGNLIKISVVTFALAKGMAALFSQMDRSFAMELPPSLKGLDEAGISARCQSEVEKFKDLVRAEFEKIGEEQPQPNEIENTK